MAGLLHRLGLGQNLAAPAHLTTHPDHHLLNMTVSFAVTAPHPEEARRVMEEMLAGVVSSYGHLEPTAGDIIVHAPWPAGYPVLANGEVTLAGSSADLLEVKE